MQVTGHAVRGWVSRRLARDAGRASLGAESLAGDGRELGPREAARWVQYLIGLGREALRSMPARETWAATVGTARVVIKATRSDLFRDAWYERLRGRAPRTPARREAEILQELAVEGFAVPRVLGWVEGEEVGLVVLEHVDHREDLEQRLARAGRGERTALLGRLADLVARFHRRGFYHRDLYLSHVVLASDDDRLVLLDLGRARRERRPRERWFVKDLAALFHSRPPAVSRAECLRWLRDYRARRALPDRSRSTLRRQARRVVAKARRLASHAPRHADPRTARPPGVAGGEVPSEDVPVVR